MSKERNTNFVRILTGKKVRIWKVKWTQPFLRKGLIQKGREKSLTILLERVVMLDKLWIFYLFILNF